MRYVLCLFILSTLCAELPIVNYSDNHKIGTQNSILAKVNGTTISMLDVKKKLDLAFHQFYPNLAESNEARFQFYQTSWRPVLMELIDNELILADATDKEIKVTDAEVREELENRFGPNVMTTLDRVGITYEESWKLIKNEIIVRKMTWWFIHSKAISSVTPQEIRQGYRLYLKEHPSYTEWKYRVITIRGPEPKALAQELYEKILSSSEQIEDLLKEFEKTHEGSLVSLSNEYISTDAKLASSHREALAPLSSGSYGSPIEQTTRDQKKVCRIFHLKEKTDHTAPSFEELSPKLKNELLQKASMEISETYLGKLRKHYRFDSAHLKETLPEDFQPFTLE